MEVPTLDLQPWYDQSRPQIESRPIASRSVSESWPLRLIGYIFFFLAFRSYWEKGCFPVKCLSEHFYLVI